MSRFVHDLQKDLKESWPGKIAEAIDDLTKDTAQEINSWFSDDVKGSSSTQPNTVTPSPPQGRKAVKRKFRGDHLNLNAKQARTGQYSIYQVNVTPTYRRK